MLSLWTLLSLVAMTTAWWGRSHKHCRDVLPAGPPAKPYAGRWYVFASTPCYDDTSSKYRYGLFNNKICKCEFVDFYSNGKSYEANIPTQFIDYSFNNGTGMYDATVIDYTLSVDQEESKQAVYVAETSSYFDDKKMSSSSSSSSSEEKKRHQQPGKTRFFFSCLADQPEYKVLYVCSKFSHLSHGKPLVWILTSQPIPSQQTVESIKSCLKTNKVEIFDNLVFTNQDGCSYSPAKEKHGAYTFIKN